MESISKTKFRDLPVSLLLGVAFCGLMGFLHGLRILDMTPALISETRNIFFLLMHSSYLYAILGLVLGAGFWLGLWVYSRLFKVSLSGTTFVRKWITLYLLGTFFLFIYLGLTRQDVRSGNFDNVLLVGYYLSTLFLGLLLAKGIKTKKNLLTGKRSRFTLKKFSSIFIVYIVLVVGLTLISASGKDVPQPLGKLTEIEAAMEQPDNGTKVAIIGWDGGEWNVINELIEQGYLPNLKSLIDNGVSAPFRSLPSTKSPLVWTSIATGKTPVKHGISDFGSFQFPGMVNNFAVYPDGLGYYRLLRRFMRQADLPISSSTRRVESFWTLLSSANRSVGVVGWWATWPAESVNGFVVSDRFTYTLFNPISSAQTVRVGQTYPPELIDEVDQFCRLPDSIMEAEYKRFMPDTDGQRSYPADWQDNEYLDWNPLYQLELAYTASESYKKAGLHLYEQYKPSMFAIYFQGIDMVSHFFWQYYRPQDYIEVAEADVQKFGSVIPEYYRYMDETLGEIMETLDPETNIMIMSDHGFGFDRNPMIPFRTGEHRVHGIFVAAGPDIRSDLKLDEVNVLDVTPTLLHLFGLPVGKDMDGDVRTELISLDFMSEHPVQSIESYETGLKVSSITRSDADQEVRDQIRALGYVN